MVIKKSNGLPTSAVIVLFNEATEKDSSRKEIVNMKLHSFGVIESISSTIVDGKGAWHVVYDTRETALLAVKCLNGSDHIDSIDHVELETPAASTVRPDDASAQDLPAHEPMLDVNMHYADPFHLQVPQLDSLHLLSPPPSPPVGWEHVVEPIPTVDQALVSAMAGLKCNEDNLIFTAGDNLPTITVLACENIDPDATHRNRALNHRDELAHRLNTGAGLLSLGGMPTGGSLKKNGFKKTPIPPRKPSARAAPKASMTNMLSV